MKMRDKAEISALCKYLNKSYFDMGYDVRWLPKEYAKKSIRVWVDVEELVSNGNLIADVDHDRNRLEKFPITERFLEHLLISLRVQTADKIKNEYWIKMEAERDAKVKCYVESEMAKIVRDINNREKLRWKKRLTGFVISLLKRRGGLMAG